MSRSRHTYLFSGKFSEMSVMSSDVILIFQNFVVPDLSQSALPSIRSVPLLPLKSSAVLPTVYMYELYVWVYIYTRALARCALRPVVYSQWWKRRCLVLVKADEGLLLCTGVNKFFFCVKKCINAFTGTQRSLGLFLWCTVLFPGHIWVSVSLVLVMSTLNHTKPFTARRVKRDK